MASESVERLRATDLTPDVVALLLTAAGPGATPAAVTEPYLQGGTLLVVRRGGAVVGLLGLDVPSGPVVAVHAMAVHPRYRSRGHGRALVEAARAHTALSLVAETDSEAVGFYSACGFDVIDLGELYPGVQQFRCLLPPPT